MSKWEEKRFSDIATVVMGQSPASSSYNEIGDGIPFLQGNRTFGMRYSKIDTYTTEPKKIVQANSILMSVRAPVGDINLAPKELCIGRGLCSIESKIGTNKFLVYLLKFNLPRLKSTENGTTFTAINSDDIRNLKVSIPSYEEQNKIANILSTYDDLIENNNKRIKLLEQMAENLYKEWFVRFRFPGYENAEFENGIPKGWNIKLLSEISDIIMGQSPKSEYYNSNEQGLPFHQGVGSYGELYLIDDVYSTQGNRIAEPNSIIFSVRAPVGRININLSKVILGRGLASINSKSNNNHFLLWQLKYMFKKENVIGNGSIFTSVTKDELLKQRVIVPKKEILEKYNHLASLCEMQIRKLYLSNQNLIKQRDLLLPRLMSGKLEVK